MVKSKRTCVNLCELSVNLPCESVNSCEMSKHPRHAYLHVSPVPHANMLELLRANKGITRKARLDAHDAGAKDLFGD
jgi:hypothetical protein